MRNQKGFTLVELVIVIVILGILAAIAVPKFVNLGGKAKEAAAEANIGALRAAATLYYAEHGQFPANKTELEACLQDSLEWPTGYGYNYYVSADRDSCSITPTW